MQNFLNYAAKIMQVDPSEINENTAYGIFRKWDSLMHMNLVMSIEEEYGIEIPINEIPNIKTLKDFYRFVAEK